MRAEQICVDVCVCVVRWRQRHRPHTLHSTRLRLCSYVPDSHTQDTNDTPGNSQHEIIDNPRKREREWERVHGDRRHWQRTTIFRTKGNVCRRQLYFYSIFLSLSVFCSRLFGPSHNSHCGAFNIFLISNIVATTEIIPNKYLPTNEERREQRATTMMTMAMAMGQWRTQYIWNK